MNGKITNVFKNMNISSIASTVNKTLNITKKAIPVYKEVKPLIEGRKTLFKKDDKKETVKTSTIKTNNIKNEYNDNLTFFE